MKRTKKIVVVDEVFEKCKKQAAKVMEDHIILPESKEVLLEDINEFAGKDECPDCEKWTKREEIKKCPDCGMKICPTCLAIHKDEHLEEAYQEEEEEVERTNKPQWR